jgi:hypothetical protein
MWGAGWLKSLERYDTPGGCFSVWGSGVVRAEEGASILLLMDGECYEGPGVGNPSALVQEYLREGPEFVRNLNGSFSLVVVDRRDGSLIAATDRLSSRKIYLLKENDRVTLCSRIEFLPCHGFTLDRAAVASFLANGAVHRHRTVYREVRVLDRASVHVLQRGEMRTKEYWQYRFTNTYAGRNYRALQQELEELLVRAVRLRCPTDSVPWMSLSAGYDASSVLGILGSRLKVKEVQCFSYAYGPPVANSDETRAGQMAALYGYPFRIVPSFAGSLATMISRNAALGQGRSHVCHEIDAYFALAELSEAANRPRMFAGDECLGWRNRPMRSWADVLHSISIYGFSVVGWIERYIGGAALQSLSVAHEEDRTAIQEACPPFGDWHDRKDYLYLAARLADVILPWRENFAGHFFRVVNPLLDYHVLDFIQKIPSNYRRGKKLFRDTVRRMLPEVFGIERAMSSTFLTYWDRAVLEQKRALLEWIESSPSPLDAVIPGEALAAILRDYTHAAGPAGIRARVKMRLKEWFREGVFYEAAERVITLSRPPPVSVPTLLGRALVLRLFLADMQKPGRQGRPMVGA